MSLSDSSESLPKIKIRAFIDAFAPFEDTAQRNKDSVGENLFQVVRNNLTKTFVNLKTKKEFRLFDELVAWSMISNSTQSFMDEKYIPIFCVIHLLSFIQFKVKMIEDSLSRSDESGEISELHSSSSSLTIVERCKLINRQRDPFSVDLSLLLEASCVLRGFDQAKLTERFFASFLSMKNMMKVSSTLDQYREIKDQIKEGTLDSVPSFQCSVNQYLEGFKTNLGDVEKGKMEDFDINVKPGRLVFEKSTFLDSNDLQNGDIFIPLEEEHPAFDFLMIAEKATRKREKVVFCFESKYSSPAHSDSTLDSKEIRSKLDKLMFFNPETNKREREPKKRFVKGIIDVPMKDVVFVVISAHSSSPLPSTFSDHNFPGPILISHRKILFRFLGSPLNNCGAFLSSVEDLKKKRPSSLSSSTSFSTSSSRMTKSSTLTTSTTTKSLTPPTTQPNPIPILFRAKEDVQGGDEYFLKFKKNDIITLLAPITSNSFVGTIGGRNGMVFYRTVVRVDESETTQEEERERAEESLPLSTMDEDSDTQSETATRKRARKSDKSRRTVKRTGTRFVHSPKTKTVKRKFFN